MAYRRNPTIITLEYDETSPFPGLHVRARSTSLHQLMTIADLVEQIGDPTAGPMNSEKIGLTRTLCAQFGERLVGWDYEDEKGNPLPATAEVLAGEEPHFVLRLVRDWMEGIQGVAPPLPSGSAGGESSMPSGLPPVDLPMEPLLPSGP